MDISKLLQQIDQCFEQNRGNDAERLMQEGIAQAVQEQDDESLLQLLNELLGYYRETGQAEASYAIAGQAVAQALRMGLEGTIPYATTLLNVANACRAAGLLRESMTYYEEVRRIYDKKLSAYDFRYASLFNNMSLLFQEMGDFESACDCLERALGIALRYPQARVEVAVTYTNLAASLLRLGRWEEAMEHLNKAFSIFEEDEEKDYHYSAALSAMGEAKYMAGDLEASAAYYRKALYEIERNVGKNKAYEITLQNLHAVMNKIEEHPAANVHFKNGMELCRAFYEEFGIPMIREKFPAYERMIAVGLVGEGSECFGFDDEISRDHDFGPGFCMWLTDQVYDEIGEELQKEYEKLPSTYMGITRFTTAKASRRVGVFRIKDFYAGLLGIEGAPVTQNQWLFLEDYRLAAATNGKVFRDDLGEFTRIRKEILAYYPEEVRLQKIARQAALMAQSGQYNYSRMFQRGEKVTAVIALSDFMKHTMAMVYLLNRTYAPFYKWMHRGMNQMKILPEIKDILNALVELPAGDERIPQTIEVIVALIIAEMKKQGLTSGEDNYLDHHTDNILKRIPVKDEEESFKNALINELVQLEWKAFDHVKNEGGRADCQDDFQTFSIMRKSQYQTWSVDLLKSYIHDFRKANENGWNLITEKYGRMMESTTPTRYAQIKDSLPQISEAKKEIIEAIVVIQVQWMEDFAARYPKAAGNARSIHTWEDNPFNTSYETYLRGEISTYSDETLDLYGRFVAQLCMDNKNLAEMTMNNTALLYGYASLEDLEDKL